MTKQVRGGNSAIMVEGVVRASDASGCLRRILLRSEGVEEEIDKRALRTFALGWLNEKLFECEASGLDIAESQRVIQEAITEEVSFGGHPDIVLKDGTPYELKSIQSANVLSKIIRQGEWKLNNLAQLVSYMISLKALRGILRYDSFIYADGLKSADFREFVVEIQDDGAVFVDGAESGITVAHVLAHRNAAAAVLEQRKVESERPMAWRYKDVNPCKYCPFLPVCDDYDRRYITTTDEFISQAKEIVKL